MHFTANQSGAIDKMDLIDRRIKELHMLNNHYKNQLLVWDTVWESPGSKSCALEELNSRALMFLTNQNVKSNGNINIWR